MAGSSVMNHSPDVVPLPEHLARCGCKGAPQRHATNCAVAIAHDAIPLTERPEYEPGRRFAAISWDFPLRVSATLNIEVELDPVAVILDNRDDYEGFVMDASYEAWEKPMVWLSQKIEEGYDCGGVYFGNRRFSRDHSYLDETSEFPRWTPADTDRLNEALAKLPDPNQGALEV